jgi:hypothetical protein
LDAIRQPNPEEDDEEEKEEAAVYPQSARFIFTSIVSTRFTWFSA